jgi:hypothetical protein
VQSRFGYPVGVSAPHDVVAGKSPRLDLEPGGVSTTSAIWVYRATLPPNQEGATDMEGTNMEDTGDMKETGDMKSGDMETGDIKETGDMETSDMKETDDMKRNH